VENLMTDARQLKLASLARGRTSPELPGCLQSTLVHIPREILFAMLFVDSV
jgi:hypothetical protein